jgi:hypothetical protein
MAPAVSEHTRAGCRRGRPGELVSVSDIVVRCCADENRGATYTARFSPTDAPARIRADLACPACGYQDPEVLHSQIVDREIHVFCDCCGAFVTIVLTDEQARALQRLSETGSGRDSD